MLALVETGGSPGSALRAREALPATVLHAKFSEEADIFHECANHSVRHMFEPHRVHQSGASLERRALAITYRSRLPQQAFLCCQFVCHSS